MLSRNFFILLFFISITGEAFDLKNQTSDSLKSGSYYKEPGSYGTKRETDPPDYIRRVSKTGKKGVDNLDWLNVGLDYRARFEIRHNDLRRLEFTTDYPLLLRSRIYLGIVNKFDPLRFAIEFEDAHRINGQFAKDTRDFNRAEVIQGYVELHFKEGFGKDDLGNKRPVYLRFGRQAFEFLDRRLIGLNTWRNTTNNFLGFRATIGQDHNDWQIDLLALRPIIRIIDEFDITDKDRDFWATIGHWRKWSESITIEPYYLGLHQRSSIATNNIERQIHSPGIRMYGWIPTSLISYDLTYTYQFGNNNGQTHKAFALTTEFGYQFKNHGWNPRVSAFFSYVTGDKSPTDNFNNRFERFYGFARPWSADDYLIPENIIAPKLRFELAPAKGLKVDCGYSLYWLASKTDRFNNLLEGTNNRDLTGKSGSFLGHGPDARFRFNPNHFMNLTIGYSHFQNGDFVENRQEAYFGIGNNVYGSEFVYIELSINIVDLFMNPKIKI